MRKKIMLWLGLGVGFLVICVVTLFFYLNSQTNAETKIKNAEFNSLLEYAKTNKSFERLAAYAAKTRFKEITFYRLGSSESSDLSSKPMAVPAQDIETVKKVMTELKKGRAVFSDPKDSPLMYTRPFVRVEFDGDSILSVEDGNLG
ncbi:MAG: hypothetical protein ACJ763_18505 [Bdellovibrionia bacterium]